MSQSLLPGGPNIIRSPMTGPDGQMSSIWQRFFSDVIQRLQNGLDIIGQFTGQIGLTATVQGRSGTLYSAIQHLTPSGQLVASQLTGTIAAAQLPAALDTAQGAVILPAGAPSNVLDTAAFQPTSAFDAAGAAASAQAASDPLGSAATAQTASEAYTDSKFASGVSGTVHLGPYTVGGTQGSLTLTNGLVTAFVDPT